ncbi:MAG: Gfo/Idh/MocA family oxidoreductase, partial [Caldilineaceae bacterium]|nr:Gfo/Idh/MocA family oxidoreductase [Caldilineaceae bacterium]
MDPIRLAIIGAGIFAHDAHLPSLLNLQGTFQIAAVYSRTAASAQALATAVAELASTKSAEKATTADVAVYTDLASLLHTPEIDAVDVVLPIPVMTPVVAQALESGKHVFSEKPIAPDVATAQQLMTHLQQPGQQWMVGENWRYESAYVQAAQLVRDGAIGEVKTCHVAFHLPMAEGSKYFGTTWRRSDEFFGGMLMDGGVHHAALLRMVIGEVASVTAQMANTSAHFAMPETLSATLAFANGVLGSYFVSYGWGSPWGGELHVTGTSGALRVQRGKIELVQQGETRQIPCAKFDGVEQEFAGFAAAIQQGVPHRNTAEAALQDVAVVEAMIRSAQTGKQQ